MKKYLLISLSILLIACSSSKQYYEPSNAQLINPINIKDASILNNFKDYEIINQKSNLTYISNALGFLKILKDKEVVFDKKFEAQIVSIATEGNKAVMVDALNNVIVFDLLEQKYLFSDNYGQANGISKLANPIFSGNVIIIPTLDGNLVILNNNDNAFIRAINVGTQEFFNNIIFLNSTQDKLIAASSSRLFTIVDNKTHTKLLNIKKALSKDDFIYVFGNDGTIYKFDLLLNEINKTKFKYANYSNAYLHNDFIYILEHQGYLIKLDTNLNEIAVFNLKSKLKDNAYFKDDLLFYNGKSYQLQ